MMVDVKSGTATILQIEEAKAARSYEEAKNVTNEELQEREMGPDDMVNLHLAMPEASYPEKAMAPHSSTLPWKIPWMEEPGGLQYMGSLRVGHDGATSLSLSCIGEGNGNPFQCSCLENPRDRGA